MKKFNHKDHIYISVLIILFLIILFSIVGFDYVNGSQVDWNSQHWIIPEYFRNLFYDTGDLFPSFAFNLGGGQNIYNLSYYGLLNPLILISYIMPNVLMINYIEVMMIIITIIDIILMYCFLHNRFESKTSFVGTLLFVLAAPIIYHTHRHIMFVDYMPFLILGLIGVDKYFEKGKKILLVISVFLIIMTSYYYSVGSLLCILIYGIYKYIETADKLTVKNFFKDGFKFIWYLLIGILMSSVLILPTFYALMNGRGEITSSVDIIKLLIPTLNLDQILYNSYTIGVTSILFLGIVYGIFSSKKENNYLSIIFILIIVFPIITYILSGFMYVRGKVLIPLLPIAILLITNAINDITVKKNIKFDIVLSVVSVIQIIYYMFQKQYILIIDVVILLISYFVYKKYAKKSILIIPVCICALICCLANNYSDKLVSKKDVENQHNVKNYRKLSELIDKDENVYRVGNQLLGLETVNRVVDVNYYLPSIYSSVLNQNYNNFANNLIGNEMQDRISTAIFSTNNILFNTYMGTKYIISKKAIPIGYTNIKDTNIYVNENVFQIGHSTSRIMSKNEYDKLSYPDNVYALMTNIIVDKDIETTYFESKIKKENLKYEIISKTVDMEKSEDNYIINSEDNGSLVLDLNKSFKNKLLFISFDMNYIESCLIGDTKITINDITNTLSCKGWTYHNKNYRFDYVISSNDAIDKLNIEFTKGKYDISNIEIYSLDYEYITNSVESVDNFTIDKKLTIGDNIVGDINVTENGYFILSIPYDKGFSIYLDGNVIDYEKVDNSFIGFEINEGHHDIKITYSSPYLFQGMIYSLIGYMLFIPIIYSDLRRKRK